MDDWNVLRKTARKTGLLYLIWVLLGLYGLMYISSKTVVKGDMVATAEKILSNEILFKTGILNGILLNVIWIVIALNLYQLLKKVNVFQAKLLVALVIVQVPVVFVSEALNLTSLLLFKGELLKTFELDQRQDLAMLLFKINSNTTIILEMFWGLWLIPFGQLVFKSGYIPKILGIFLIINGVAYILFCFISIFLQSYQSLAFKIATPFWTLGEISIMLWLLIKGIKVEKSK